MADTTPSTASPSSVQVKPTAPQSRPVQKQERKELPPYNVVLLDDNDHTVAYVVEMLGRLFGHNTQRATAMAQTVDRQGRVIVLTTHRERAELKRDQIRGFGCDPRVENSHCSMGAIIEPAEG